MPVLAWAAAVAASAAGLWLLGRAVKFVHEQRLLNDIRSGGL